MKPDKNKVFARNVHFCFDFLVTKGEKIQTGENHVWQGLSNVFVFYLDSSTKGLVLKLLFPVH